MFGSLGLVYDPPPPPPPPPPPGGGGGGGGGGGSGIFRNPGNHLIRKGVVTPGHYRVGDVFDKTDPKQPRYRGKRASVSIEAIEKGQER